MTNEELATQLEKLAQDRDHKIASFRIEYLDVLEEAAIRLRAAPDS